MGGHAICLAWDKNLALKPLGQTLQQNLPYPAFELPGTSFYWAPPPTAFKPHKINFLSQSAARAGQGQVTCVPSVFNMQPQCLHSLHVVFTQSARSVSPPSGFSKDAITVG